MAVLAAVHEATPSMLTQNTEPPHTASLTLQSILFSTFYDQLCTVTVHSSITGLSENYTMNPHH
jgi:hypothetical protein